MIILLSNNPFFDAYVESDFLGKLIFLSLIALSIVTWSILIYKIWVTKQVRQKSHEFRKAFHEMRNTPLEVAYTLKSHRECPNAFYIVYDVVRNNATHLLDKNRELSTNAYLTPSDIALLDSQAGSIIASLTKFLDKNLYILSTITTLAPFLGLLGTVYGILTTFSGMQGASATSNQMVLGGLSLALTTTIIGLVDAIPALIGYNYLKNQVHDFDTEMDRFANDVLSSVELHYRRVE